MRAFSQLLDDLVYTRSRNSKLRLIGEYLKETPDPDRGIALAALTGTLDIPAVKPAAIRALAEERIDPVLLRMSRDYVGDMAETVSLLWPTGAGERQPYAERCEIDDGSIRISDAVDRLRLASKADAPEELARMLDHLDASGRFALLKLATGALRVGISARLAKQALADAFGLDVDQVEEVWHGLRPPYAELFDWGEGRAPQPTARDVPVFRPASTIMLPSGNGTGSASSSSMPGAIRGSTAGPAMTLAGAFPISRKRSRFRRCSTGSCWSAARARGRKSMAGRRRASMRFSSGSAGRTSAPGCAANILPSFGYMTSSSTARRICVAFHGASGAGGWRPL
jgi:hypothetical protein